MRGAPPTCTAPKFVACLTCELSSRSRDSVVLVDHAAEYFAALHRCAERHDDRLVVVGWSLTAGLVRPVVGVPSQHPPQVLFVVDQHPVGALGPYGAHPPLGIAIGPGRPRRTLHDLHALAGEDIVETRG